MKPRSVAAVAVLCLMAGGCGVPTDGGPRDLDRPRSNDRSSAPVADPLGPATERLFLVHGGKLVRTLRRVPAARTPSQLVQDLRSGPTQAEQQDGLTSALSTMNVGAVSVAQRRVAVEVGAGPDQAARSDEVLAFGQIVCTLTSQGPDVGTVSFTRGGQPLAVPRGDGSLSAAPLTVADYAELIGS